MENKFIHKVRAFLIVFALSFYLVGTMYLAWYHVIDGELIRKPVTFLIDIQNVQLDKDKYRKGDEIAGLFKFCKNRPAKAYVIPVLYNEETKTLPATKVSGVPVGCYPQNPENEFSKFAFGILPHSATKGEHWIGGYIVEVLPTGKEIRIPFRTESFMVE